MVFYGFYYVTQNSQHWLAEPFWTEYTVGSACIESNVLYRKMMSKGSGVKPLFLCVKIFVTVAFIISIQQTSGA